MEPDRDAVMVALQWLGFVNLVAGTYFYTTHGRTAAALTVAGCAFLGTWALLLHPVAWGSFAVQAVVAVLSVRNFIRWHREA